MGMRNVCNTQIEIEPNEWMLGNVIYPTTQQ